MSDITKIKIILVEDDPDWVKVMTGFLNNNPDLEVVGIANGREEALSVVRDVEADVLLMDINLSENKRDGIAAALDILAISKIRIIMLTSLNEAELITDSFAVGAVDYVPKDHYQDIPTVIRRVVRESSPMDALLKDYARLKREEQLQELTATEREIFDLFEQGYSSTQIEEKMFKTHNTLKTQVKNILNKLQVNNRLEAIKKVDSKGVYGKYDDEDRNKS